MIKIYDFLWKRLADYGKKFQSGMDTVEEFNGKVNEVQLEIVSELSPHYQGNELVRGIIAPWVRRYASVSTVNGLIDKPSSGQDFMRVLSLSVVDNQGNYLFPINQYTENELGVSSRIPQRKPDLSKKIAAYTPLGNQIQLNPKQAISYEMFFLVYPTDAKLSFTYTQNDDEDVMIVDVANTVDLGWDKNAANLILYKLLEKYGITNREQLLIEYAKIGVTMSMGGSTND